MFDDNTFEESTSFAFRLLVAMLFPMKFPVEVMLDDSRDPAWIPPFTRAFFSTIRFEVDICSATTFEDWNSCALTLDVKMLDVNKLEVVMFSLSLKFDIISSVLFDNSLK